MPKGRALEWTVPDLHFPDVVEAPTRLVYDKPCYDGDLREFIERMWAWRIDQIIKDAAEASHAQG